MTLKINGTANRKTVKMDIDLVPCFIFDKNKWPTGGYRQNPVPEKVTILFLNKKINISEPFCYSLRSLLYRKSQVKYLVQKKDTGDYHFKNKKGN